jgi:hypothetical protein
MNFRTLIKSLGVRHLILFISMVLVYTLIFLPVKTFHFLTDEDAIFESLTAIFFLLAAISCALLFANVNYFKEPQDRLTYNSFFRRWVLILFAVLFFFGCGEEISWGQRLLGFKPPEVVAERNAQGEFNIHNLEFMGLWKKGGNRRNGLAAFFRVKKLFVLFFAGYLFVLPIMTAYSEKIRRLVRRFYIPAPPFWIGIFFVANVLLYNLFKPFIFDNDLREKGLGELEEFNFSFLLFLLPLYWLSLNRVLRKNSNEEGTH